MRPSFWLYASPSWNFFLCPNFHHILNLQRFLKPFKGVIPRSSSTVSQFFPCLHSLKLWFRWWLDLLLGMTDQAISYDLTGITRQAFDKEIDVVKDLTRNPEMPFARLSTTVTFACQSCQKTKTSKLVAFLGGDPTKRICNACYGTQMTGWMDQSNGSRIFLHHMFMWLVCKLRAVGPGHMLVLFERGWRDFADCGR